VPLNNEQMIPIILEPYIQCQFPTATLGVLRPTYKLYARIRVAESDFPQEPPVKRGRKAISSSIVPVLRAQQPGPMLAGGIGRGNEGRTAGESDTSETTQQRLFQAIDYGYEDERIF
jgi:hypothetical protein